MTVVVIMTVVEEEEVMVEVALEIMKMLEVMERWYRRMLLLLRLVRMILLQLSLMMMILMILMMIIMMVVMVPVAMVMMVPRWEVVLVVVKLPGAGEGGRSPFVILPHHR